MKHEIVVARYIENVEWALELSRKGYNVKIYNKHDGENLLPNVGREAHTYLHHIVTNWNHLADFTVFLQGNPFEHASNAIHLVSEILNENIDFDFAPITSMGFIICDKNSQPHGINNQKVIPTGKLFEWLTLTPSPEIFIASPGAQFVVSRNAIQSKTKKFYQRALKAVEYANNPVEAHCFERMWPTLFGVNISPSTNVIFYEEGEESFRSLGLTASEYVEKYISNGRVTDLGELHESYESL